jgi:biopolymer transport protein TolQ
VIAYNRYTARLNRQLARYETFAEEFSSILHRQAHSVTRGGGE